MGNFVSDIFDIRSIKLGLEGKTKEMALVDLIEGIASLNPEYNAVDLLSAVRKREEQMTTGIGYGVAVPHAICRGISNIAGAIGISRQGIDFSSLDNKPVHVIFLLLISEKMEENHLRVLNTIFRLAQSEALAQIISANNAEDIHTILSRIHLS